MQKRLPNTTITVPVPNHAELHIGTLLSLIRRLEYPETNSNADRFPPDFMFQHFFNGRSRRTRLEY